MTVAAGNHGACGQMRTAILFDNRKRRIESNGNLQDGVRL